MHALVIRVSIADREKAEEFLKAQVVPNVSQAPGFVAGYWAHLGDDKGASMIVFESEDAAKAVEGRLREPPPEFVTFESTDVGEVVASA
jgi:heme-degrading monooxygenase HmoA